MAKAYWINTVRSISDPQKVADYAAIAGPVIEAGGGRFIVRGQPAHVFGAGIMERTVVIEFDSIEQALAVHDGPDYQEALRVLGDGAVRDLRFVEGVES